MALADLNTYKDCIGDFMHTQTRVRFSYAPRGDKFGEYRLDLPHVVHVASASGGIELRLAIVRKTVAYVLVDEGVLERWPIVQHCTYPART